MNNMNNMNNMNEEKLTEMVNEVIEKKRSGYYAAGTLCIDHPEFVMLSVSDEKLSGGLRYALAKCYVKYKNENCAFWDMSKKFIKEWEQI